VLNDRDESIVQKYPHSAPPVVLKKLQVMSDLQQRHHATHDNNSVRR
jgi:hypothetical protein